MAIGVVGASHFLLQVPVVVRVPERLLVRIELIPRVPCVLHFRVEKLCARQFPAEFVGRALEFLLGFRLLLRVSLRFLQASGVPEVRGVLPAARGRRGS